MPNPWDTLQLIEDNLLQIATLKVGEKLGRPDGRGLFQKHTTDSGRRAADSITSLAEDLKRFLKRAVVVAICDEAIPTKEADLNRQNNPQGRPASLPPRKVFGLLTAVLSIGLPNLKATYSRGSMFKSKQRTAVDGLVTFIQQEMALRERWMETTATAAFHFVRTKYQAGYKSSNKRYVASPDGKYSAADAVGAGSKHPKTLENRNQQRSIASRTITKQRNKTNSEEVAKSFSLNQINQEITSLETALDQFVANHLGAGKTYRSLSKKDSDNLYATVKATDANAAKDFADTRKNLEIFEEGRRILQTNASPVDPWNAKAGNCGELAKLARLRLEQDHLPFICEASLSGLVDGHRGDHVFTIFGLRLPKHHSRFSDDNLFLKKEDRAHLRSAWIIDPWVNLCCRIDQYPSRFWAKMQSWSGNGKQISVGGSWIDPHPMSNSWYARSIFELDWKITEYRPYDPEVFKAEEHAQRMQNQFGLLGLGN
jgi:hypothetical protein